MKNVVTFPNDSRADERIERVAKEADDDDEVCGYICLIVTKTDGMSFKFGVPNNGSQLDEMVGALERIKLRLMQYNGELDGR